VLLATKPLDARHSSSLCSSSWTSQQQQCRAKMPLNQLVNFLTECSPQHAYSEKPFDRISEIVRSTWYLGFTSFGGPAVHFQIFHKKFVEEKEGRTPWIDEQTVCSSSSGRALCRHKSLSCCMHRMVTC